MRTLRIIVAGSRTFTDYNLLKRHLNDITAGAEVTVISGTARGADQFGERWAAEHNHHVEQYPAEWNKYGKSAGYRRNEIMAQNATVLAAFWDGQSRGTKHMIDLAYKHGLKVYIN